MVAGPATITKERMERYRFSVPIAEATVALLKRTGDDTVMKPEDIAGKTVGSGKATAQLAQLSAYAETLPEPIETKEYRELQRGLCRSRRGAGRRGGELVPEHRLRGAAAAGDLRAGRAAVRRRRPTSAIPAARTTTTKTLMDAIDAAIVEIKADGRLAEYQKKWFGVTFDTPDAPSPKPPSEPART